METENQNNEQKANNVILVSAYVSNVSGQNWSDSEQTRKKYQEQCIPLLQCNIKKVIFIDESVIENYKSYENENTKIIPFVKESNYLYDCVDKITDFKVNSTNPSKDTLQYMFTQCHKTEWVKQAIEIMEKEDPDTDQFVWVDFGIKHVFHCSDEEFIQKMERLIYCKYDDKIRIGNIWNDYVTECQVDTDWEEGITVSNSKPSYIYADVCWFFTGGVFGGNKNILLVFAHEMKNLCLDIINTKRTLMWEVNIWYLLYKKNRDLFLTYSANHNSSIIDNY